MALYQSVAHFVEGGFLALARAYRYGGVRESVGCIFDGVTAVTDTLVYRLLRRDHHRVLWPSFSPELLAYRPYRTFTHEFDHGDIKRLSEFLNTAQVEKDVQRDAVTALRRLERSLQHAYGIPEVKLVGAEGDEKWRIDFSAAPQQLVSIIIPTRDQAGLLKACVDSIHKFTKGVPYEIIIVDNGSVEHATKMYLAELPEMSECCIRVIEDDGIFNWSRLNNFAAEQATGSTLVFLNNDIVVRSSDWLIQLAGFAGAHGVGCVGAMLLFDDGSIQHAGVVVGIGRWADHIYKGASPDLTMDDTPFVPPSVTRPVLAITGACIAVSRKNFAELGGFDEAFSVIFSDIDLCVRAHRAGLRNIYCADVRLIHHESKTRDPKRLPDADFRRASRMLAPYRVDQVDPYFNRALDKLSLFPRRRGEGVDLSRWVRIQR